MNYAELQQAIIEDTHRPDLGPLGPNDLIPRFIREGEGMIRRELVAYILTTTLTETDRATIPTQYTLPSGVLMIRRVAIQGALGGDVTRIALGSITSYTDTQRVAVYAEPGDGLIEFRGSPPTDTIFDLNYFGVPAPLVNPEDTNALLDENETLYKTAAMVFLYINTQDRELGADSLDLFRSILTTLNEEIARKIGGAQITASYNFGGRGGY